MNSEVRYAKPVPRTTLGPPPFSSTSAPSRDFAGVVPASCMALRVGVLLPAGALENCQVIPAMAPRENLYMLSLYVELQQTNFPRENMAIRPERKGASTARLTARPPYVSSSAPRSLVLREEMLLSQQLVQYPDSWNTELMLNKPSP